MTAFGLDGFAQPAAVTVEVYTGAYRISGTVRTPFRRVLADVLDERTAEAWLRSAEGRG